MLYQELLSSKDYFLHKAKATYFFVVRTAERIVSSKSVGKIIIIILSFKVSTSKK